MKTIQLFLLGTFCLLMTACSTSMRVESSYKNTTDFSRLDSYQLQTPENLSDKVSPAHKLVIEEAIRKEMNGQSYREEENEASFTVSYFVIVNTIKDYNSYSHYYGRNRWSYGSLHAREYKAGTLIIDLIDTQSKKILWHGAVSDTVVEDFEATSQKIQTAVKSIFEKYRQDSSFAQTL